MCCRYCNAVVHCVSSAAGDACQWCDTWNAIRADLECHLMPDQWRECYEWVAREGVVPFFSEVGVDVGWVGWVCAYASALQQDEAGEEDDDEEAGGEEEGGSEEEGSEEEGSEDEEEGSEDEEGGEEAGGSEEEGSEERVDSALLLGGELPDEDDSDDSDYSSDGDRPPTSVRTRSMM